MCGIVGWVDWNDDLTRRADVLERMTETMEHRGPDARGTWLSRHCALGHRRLCVIDPANGAQPMVRAALDDMDRQFVIIYNGELYNTQELRDEFRRRGYRFRTSCDTEVLLVSYIEWGKACVDRLNGIFAFAVWSVADEELFIARDRLGVKPLFYRLDGERLLFGSEPKAILAHPDVRAEVDAEGLAEVFAIGPARTPGHGVWRGMRELKPGHCLTFDRSGLRISAYWRLEAAPCADGEHAAAARVRELLRDAARRQMVSDVPVCTLLSGGLDSSALTALAAEYYRETGRGALHTYSVDYVDNERHFRAHAFQPDADGPWIERMSDHLDTVHHAVRIDTPELVDALEAAVVAKDMPGMADIDSSLYLFSREIKKGATVAISGEAADEIFGGYPWFHREEMLRADTFPWSMSSDLREEILSPELARIVRPREYAAERYREAVAEVPVADGEDDASRRMRRISYLSITRFMPTLLDRKDRMSMAWGLEVRVPYCDHRLVEYVWNLPWSVKSAGGREKGILRRALEGVLPPDVLQRRKSPYPKTHNPAYLAAVRERLLARLDDPSCPLLPLVNAAKIRELAEDPRSATHLPWFGQLMSGPQLFAYLLQVDFWLRHYRVSLAV